MSESQFDVLIIGGGFSGTMLGIHLLGNSSCLSVAIVDRGAAAGRAMHSRNGEIWTHGVNGEHEFGSCNPQGCYMWDGTVEALYAEHEHYWALPQDCSMTFTWAIAGAHACTIRRGGVHGSAQCSSTASSQPGPIECGPATATEKPQPRPEAD